MEQGFKHEPKRTKKSTAGFPCKECEYVATRAGNLKAHAENKHKGVRYPCSQCKYAATTTGGLKIHVENKYKGVRYPCPECD